MSDAELCGEASVPRLRDIHPLVSGFMPLMLVERNPSLLDLRQGTVHVSMQLVGVGVHTGTVHTMPWVIYPVLHDVLENGIERPLRRDLAVVPGRIDALHRLP
jgi:hypothetical protein